MQLGKLLLGHFWAGNAHAFLDRDHNKELRFERFFDKEKTNIARLGVSQRQAQDSIRAAIVVHTLPVTVAEKLLFSQLLVLTRLQDPIARAQIAEIALTQDWSVTQMRDAVAAS